MATDSPSSRGLTGRVRGASLSLLNANPQLGMWQATGTAIAQAPNLTELRDADSGGDNIAFNAQGHSARIAVQESDGELALVKSITRDGLRKTTTAPTVGPVLEERDDEMRSTITEPTIESTIESATEAEGKKGGHHHHHHHGLHLREMHHRHLERRRTLHEKHKSQVKEKWGPTILHGLKAFWKFFLTPSGFLITIYGLNVVAWGAMLFFLLLKAAPAMNHPSADDDNSPRKKWLEVDSQILNALFCVTGFGLAPWRFRDLYYFIRAAHFKDRRAMDKLAEQNKAWFRPPAWAVDVDGNGNDTRLEKSSSTTFTGGVAPPTALWKLAFTIWMMVLNTAFQAVLCYYMWGYNRIDRPSWATGTFIGLGCGVAMLAGLMSWWEGRKVKKIEGPRVQIVETA